MLTRDNLEYTFNFLSIYSRCIVEHVCRIWRNASIFGTHQIKSLTFYKYFYCTNCFNDFSIDNDECNNCGCEINRDDDNWDIIWGEFKSSYSDYMQIIFRRHGICGLKKISTNLNILNFINISSLKNLTHFELNTYDDLEYLIDIFKYGKLQYLKLNIYNGNINIIENVSNCNRLRYFELNTRYPITSKEFNSILKCEYIDINNVKLCDEDFIKTNQCLNLKHLLIPRVKLQLVSDKLETILLLDSCVEDIKYITRFKMLKCLRILDCELSDDNLKYISKCIMLESFYIAQCFNVTQVGLEYVIMCKRLKYICIANCNGDTKDFRQKCRRLGIKCGTS